IDLAFVALFAFTLASQAHAQDKPTTVSSLAGLYNMTISFIHQTAEMMDDDMLAYRPSVNVQTVQGHFGHIINAQFGLCALAAGEENPGEGDYEELAMTKEAIIAGLEASTAYCNGVYESMSEEDAAAQRTFFGQEVTAAAVLSFKTTHNYQHYGSLVTYMRINGLVPPSSQ
ncbi:MAG: DinB family protein, partial [Bacteroidota bacterium]